MRTTHCCRRLRRLIENNLPFIAECCFPLNYGPVYVIEWCCFLMGNFFVSKLLNVWEKLFGRSGMLKWIHIHWLSMRTILRICILIQLFRFVWTAHFRRISEYLLMWNLTKGLWTCVSRCIFRDICRSSIVWALPIGANWTNTWIYFIILSRMRACLDLLIFHECFSKKSLLVHTIGFHIVRNCLLWKILMSIIWRSWISSYLWERHNWMVRLFGWCLAFNKSQRSRFSLIWWNWRKHLEGLWFICLAKILWWNPRRFLIPIVWKEYWIIIPEISL